MKIKSLITALGLALSMLATAQDYCLTAPFGYGASATGGTGGSVVKVTSASQLESALLSSGKKIIIVTQNIQFTSLLKVKATDKTLLGLPGVKLYNNTVPTNASDAAAKTGILYFKENSKNVIIRNLIFQGSGAFDSESADGLCLDAVTNFWIDHCDFQDGVDGNFDIKNATDNITVTWCRFRYLKSPKSKSSWTADKGTDDHRYSNLVGSGSSDKPSNRRITYAYNWWDEGCVQRMPRARHSQFHLLNNYWSSSVASACLGLGGCTAYIEGCYFTQKKSVIYKDYSSDDGASSNKLKFVDSYGAKDGLPSNVGTVSAPTYSYTALSYSETKTAVTNSTCGAGATLNVTAAGVVSSSCSSSGGGNVDPDPTPDPTPTGETETTIIDFTKGSVEDAVSAPLTASCVTVGTTNSSFDNGFKVGTKADEVNINISSISGYVITNVKFDVTYSYSKAVDKVGTGNPITYTYNTGSGDKTVDITSTSGSAIANINFGVNDNVKTIRLIRNVGTSMTIGKITLTLSKVSATTAVDVADAEKADWTVTNDEVSYSADVQKISIYDFAGHNLLSGSLVPYLNISGLAAGNYIAVAILPNGKLATLKFNKK